MKFLKMLKTALLCAAIILILMYVVGRLRDRGADTPREPKQPPVEAPGNPDLPRE